MMMLANIEEKNPLKQGLKPHDPKGCVLKFKIEEKNPLKQGLKRACTIPFHLDW